MREFCKYRDSIKSSNLFFSSSFNLIVTSTLLQSFNRSLFLGHLDFLRITKLAMGGAPSTAEPAASKAKLHRNEKEIVKLMMPVYYTVQEVSIEERKLASNSWDLILNEKSPEFFVQERGPRLSLSKLCHFLLRFLLPAIIRCTSSL